MEEYKPGEKLRVTLEATAYHASNGVLHLAYAPENDRRILSIVLDRPGVTIERVAPAEGVEAGDLWRDADGDLWFARLVDSDLDGEDPFIHMTPATSRKVSEYGFDGPGEVHRKHVLVELVRRESSAPDPEQAAFIERLREGGKDFPAVGEPEAVPIGGVTPGAIVKTPDWNDGRPVRIVSVQDAGEHYDEVQVHYENPTLVGPISVTHVAATFQVTPVAEEV